MTHEEIKMKMFMNCLIKFDSEKIIKKLQIFFIEKDFVVHYRPTHTPTYTEFFLYL